MTISRKEKRKIVIDGQELLWFVKVDHDYYDQYHLNIISPTDRQLCIAYTLGKDAMKDAHHGYIRCPIWATERITPQIVRDIYNWYFSKKTLPIFINWRGDECKVFDVLSGDNPMMQLLPNIANFNKDILTLGEDNNVDIYFSFWPVVFDDKFADVAFKFQNVVLPSMKLSTLAEQSIAFIENEIIGVFSLGEIQHKVILTQLVFDKREDDNMPVTVSGKVIRDNSEKYATPLVNAPFEFNFEKCFFM